MSKLIAIIAPMLTDKQYEADFRILLKNNNQELNLKFFYEYIKNNYVIRDLKNRYSYKEDVIPAAGFFLSSKLRRSGYDTILTQFFDDSTLQDIARKNPLAVCISTTMILRKNACLQVIRQIKKNIPNIKIIIGGILTWKSYLVYIKGNKNDTVNINDEEWNLFKHFNDEFNNCLFITSPHGLSLLLCILKEIEKGKNADFFNIPNLVLPLKNSLYFTKYMEEIFDLNDEFTNWELLDKLPHRIPIRTSIGCSYRCTFCDFCTLYPKIIFRNINSIYKELITIKNVVESRHQPVILHFTDDNIFNTKQRLQDVCETIIKSQVESPWISFMRASSVNDSNIKLLKESNLLMTMMGIESGDPQILQAMNKKQDLDKVKIIIELLDENRISTLMYFIVGFPGENKKTLENTAAFINSIDLHNIFVTYQLYPLKISDLSRISNDENRRRWNLTGSSNKWKHYTMDSKQAEKETYLLFKSILNIPYHYLEENNFFNYRFTFEQRKKLFNLRKDLTIAIFEKFKEKIVHTIFINIALTMGLPPKTPGNEIIKQLSVQGCSNSD